MVGQPKIFPSSFGAVVGSGISDPPPLLVLLLDPGSEIRDPRSGIRNPRSGINIPDPQHWKEFN